MCISKDDAIDLAVRYHAYVSAESDNSICVWGRMLLVCQQRLGVNLVDVSNTESRVASAERRLERAKEVDIIRFRAEARAPT